MLSRRCRAGVAGTRQEQRRNSTMLKLACLSLSYKRSFAAGTMDLFSFIERCRALGPRRH